MFYFLVFLIGIAVGSFLNVLIDRLPAEESITGRSHCDHCKKDLAWYDLLPILSYVYLGARCRYCGGSMSIYYPLVEVITGAMFVGVVVWMRPMSQIRLMADRGETLLTIHNQTLMLLALLGIVSSAIVIFFSDLKYQIIPDSIQMSLFAFAFLFIITQGITPKVFLDQIIAAFVVMSPILMLFWLTKTKGMGFGDVKLAFSMGFLLGILKGVLALYIGFVSGAVVGIILLALRKKGFKSKIAFGPFLILGLLIMLFYGENIVQIFNSIYSL